VIFLDKRNQSCSDIQPYTRICAERRMAKGSVLRISISSFSGNL